MNCVHQTGRLLRLAFGTRPHGYLVTPFGGLLITNDGGLTLEGQPRVTLSDLTGVAAIGDNIATVVGDYGVILRTTTGGR